MADGEKSIDLTRDPADLKTSKRASDLLNHHEQVLSSAQGSDQLAQVCLEFLRGIQYSAEELQVFKTKRKTPVVYNKLKVFSRTMVGSFLSNKYDVKWSPVEPGDNDLSEVMEKIRIWQAGTNGDRKWVPEIVQRAYATGRGYLECWMEIVPGRIPVMRSRLLPTLAVHWDPESRDPITRRDASFCDIDTWLSLDQLCEEFPKHASNLREGAGTAAAGGNSYTPVPLVDSWQGATDIRNGRYHVVERYYKVRTKKFFAVQDGSRVDILKDQLEDFYREFPGEQVYHETGWSLNLAVAAQGIQGDFYLYNGPYHCNPTDPTTGEVIWPVQELVAESLEGVPQGFVETELDPQRAFNALMSNVLHSAKHAASQSQLIDFSAFVSDDEAKAAATYHSDADRAFRVKQGRTQDAMKPIEHSQVTNDTYTALDQTSAFMTEASSTPPAMQGVSESSSTSGLLNAQRIEQSYIQLQGFIANFRAFLESLYLLRYAYTRIYYTDEMIIRVTKEGAKGSPEFLELNKPQVEWDPIAGQNKVTLLNDINSMVYDITVEDSTRTPTYRAQILAQITQMFQSNAATQDPVLGAALFQEFVDLSDMSAEVKEFIKSYNSQLKQWEVQRKGLEQQEQQLKVQGQQVQNAGAEQQQQQAAIQGEMQNFGQMQALAQAEAEQTVGAMPPSETAEPSEEPAMAGY